MTDTGLTEKQIAEVEQGVMLRQIRDILDTTDNLT